MDPGAGTATATRRHPYTPTYIHRDTRAHTSTSARSQVRNHDWLTGAYQCEPARDSCRQTASNTNDRCLNPTPTGNVPCTTHYDDSSAHAIKTHSMSLARTMSLYETPAPTKPVPVPTPHAFRTEEQDATGCTTHARTSAVDHITVHEWVVQPSMQIPRRRCLVATQGTNPTPIVKPP